MAEAQKSSTHMFPSYKMLWQAITLMASDKPHVLLFFCSQVASQAHSLSLWDFGQRDINGKYLCIGTCLLRIQIFRKILVRNQLSFCEKLHRALWRSQRTDDTRQLTVSTELPESVKEGNPSASAGEAERSLPNFV